jgi:hypothetical protein
MTGFIELLKGVKAGPSTRSPLAAANFAQDDNLFIRMTISSSG